MGRIYAEGIAETDLPLEAQLEWHLKSNHFPPIPAIMVKPCLEAINAYNEGERDKLISLPEGVGYRGLTAAPASAIVEQHHLETWLAEGEEY
jgi:hypothetical protein